MGHRHRIEMVDVTAHSLLATDQEVSVTMAASIHLPAFLVEVAVPEAELLSIAVEYLTAVVDSTLCDMKKKNLSGK
jgi:hypothetical protein